MDLIRVNELNRFEGEAKGMLGTPNFVPDLGTQVEIAPTV